MGNPLFKALCITRHNQEEHLCQEFQLRAPDSTIERVGPQLVAICTQDHSLLSQAPIFFSSQLLPYPEEITAESVSLWAQIILDRLVRTFNDTPHSWCLHIFDVLTVETGDPYARPSRIRQSLLDLLKLKRRTLLKSLREDMEQDCYLVQVVLVSPTSGFISVAAPSLRAAFRSAISSYVAGYVHITDDKSPPSRAFKKLREAIEVFNLPIKSGDTVVDLGASPGGWTHVLRERGALVTAVDRSPLAPQLMRDKNVTFVAGDARTWVPTTRVDWLVCDVITTPEHTKDILVSWISKKLCSHFCVTVKFKGEPAFLVLRDLGIFLRSHTSWFDGHQLTHNKNEVTVVGAV